MASIEITTPRGRIVTTKAGTARLQWNPGFQSAANRKLAKGGTAQAFVDSAVLAGCDPYIPMRTGMAKKSGILNTVIGEGMVKWSTPYIRRIYYGKSSTGKKLNYHGGGKRGAFWCERYKADHLGELKKAVNSKIRGSVT